MTTAQADQLEVAGIIWPYYSDRYSKGFYFSEWCAVNAIDRLTARAATNFRSASAASGRASLNGASLVQETQGMVKTAHTEPSKERSLSATARLLAERGYDGVGLALIAKVAETTTGSLYFHFPDGKESLAVAAIDGAAEGLRQRIAGALSKGGPAEVAHMWADFLEASDWRSGCPVAATTLQMSTRSEALRQAGQRAFDLWQSEIAQPLAKSNPNKEEVKFAARRILSLLEGAELLSRTARSRAPLDDAAEVMDLLVTNRSGSK